MYILIAYDGERLAHCHVEWPIKFAIGEYINLSSIGFRITDIQHRISEKRVRVFLSDTHPSSMDELLKDSAWVLGDA